MSAAGAVGDEGFYTWGSTQQMVADVQMWLDDPASDFGWLVKADTVQAQTTKRFDTRENPTAGYRPVLTVSFETAWCGADLDGDGLVGISDFLSLLALWGTNPAGPPDPDGDGVVGIADFLELLANCDQRRADWKNGRSHAIMRLPCSRPPQNTRSAS